MASLNYTDHGEMVREKLKKKLKRNTLYLWSHNWPCFLFTSLYYLWPWLWLLNYLQNGDNVCFHSVHIFQMSMSFVPSFWDQCCHWSCYEDFVQRCLTIIVVNKSCIALKKHFQCHRKKWYLFSRTIYLLWKYLLFHDRTRKWLTRIWSL